MTVNTRIEALLKKPVCRLAAFAIAACTAMQSVPAAAQSQWNPTPSELAGLAQRFRPYLKFSTGSRQEARPMTWQRLYSYSRLKNGKNTVVNIGGLSGSGASKVLQVADVRYKWPAAKAYSIIIDDSQRYGEYWPSIAQGDGVYAHVNWLKPLTGEHNSDRLVNIEYWVLFGFNVGYVPNEDHYGDVIGVQIVYDHANDKIVRAAFSEHGRTLIMFDLMGASVDPNAELHGKDANGAKIAQAACKLSVNDHEYYAGGLSGGPGIFSGGDKHVFMAKDPNTGKCEHLAVYMEHGSHEPWPNQSGYYIGVASHNGDDFSVLPASVHVLDASDDAFVYFGGSYGDPTGMTRHRMWLGYDRNADPTDPDPYIDHGNLHWLPTLPDPPAVSKVPTCDSVREAILGLEKEIYQEQQKPPACPTGIVAICTQKLKADQAALLQAKADYGRRCPPPVPVWSPQP